jgi:nitroreductase/FMN reductase [NAD(P)H]
MIVVFCGNNRRQRLLHEWHDIAFANDHLDAFFNAVGDSAIALGAFVTAAEAIGLGCCPISAVRNEAEAVSTLLGLPDHVFPFAGLALGFPSGTAKVAKRLPLQVTCHIDRYQDDTLREAVQDYDERRSKTQPYESQRFPQIFGEMENYVWSADKVRQYSQPERSDFGKYVRSRGFILD